MTASELIQQVEERHQRMLRSDWEFLGAATRQALEDNHKALVDALKILRLHGHRKEKPK